MRRMLAFVLAAALVAGAGTAARDAGAKPPDGTSATQSRRGQHQHEKAVAEPQVQLPPGTVDKLRSGDDPTVRAALDDVRTAGKGAASVAPVIVDLLDRGVSAEVTVAAIDTLGDIESPAASRVLAWYAVHRTPAVRQAAVKALARTKGPEAVTALRHALSDDDAMVRGMAATGLGSLKAKEAVRDLFTALDHRVGEAAASIGQLCSPAECEELTGKLGKVPFDVVTGGLDQVLFRPPTELDDDEKVKVIGRIRELGTEEANKFLRDVQKRWPAGWSARVKQAIDQGVMATNGVSQ